MTPYTLAKDAGMPTKDAVLFAKLVEHMHRDGNLPDWYIKNWPRKHMERFAAYVNTINSRVKDGIKDGSIKLID